MNMQRCIHLIEKQRRFKSLGNDEYESGYWDIREDKAQRLIGGSIFFHRSQAEPSFYGGTILRYRIATNNDSKEYANRIIFIFHYSRDHRDVVPDIRGWGNEKKIVLDE